MLGSLLSRVFIMALGYAYPAYQCYKTVEKNKPDIEKLRFWCQYWILVALLTVLERFGDVIISWLPFYNEAKIAFFIYLWYPKTMGTVYIYDGFFRPYVSLHEADIDQNLLEIRVRATDAIVMFWRQFATYGQTRFFEILQYFASQSYSIRNRPSQRQQQEQEQKPHQQLNQTPPIVSTRQPSVRHQQQQQQPQEQLQQTPSVTQQKQDEEHPEQKEHRRPHRIMLTRSHVLSMREQSSQSSEATIDDAPQVPQITLPTLRHTGIINAEVDNSESSDREVTPTESPFISENEDSNSNPMEVMMEDAIRVTSARLRRNLSSRTPADPASAI